MFRPVLQRCLKLPTISNMRFLGSTEPISGDRDKLFSKITIELRGHEPAVLLSYTSFLKNACEHLEINSSDIRNLPKVQWLQWALKSKFVHKKKKVHYHTLTYIKQMDVFHLTGSTAGTFLEYIQRNIPEGVAMRVDYYEMCALPESIQKMIENNSKTQ